MNINREGNPADSIPLPPVLGLEWHDEGIRVPSRQKYQSAPPPATPFDAYIDRIQFGRETSAEKLDRLHLLTTAPRSQRRQQWNQEVEKSVPLAYTGMAVYFEEHGGSLARRLRSFVTKPAVAQTVAAANILYSKAQNSSRQRLGGLQRPDVTWSDIPNAFRVMRFLAIHDVQGGRPEDDTVRKLGDIVQMHVDLVFEPARQRQEWVATDS